MKKIIRAIVNDIKTDIETIGQITSGKLSGKLKDRLKELVSVFKQANFYGILGFALICLIASFVLGWVVASQYYEMQAHNVIMEVTEKAQTYCQRQGESFPELNYTIEPFSIT